MAPSRWAHGAGAASRWAHIACAAGLALALGSAAASCGDTLPGRARLQAEAEGRRLVFSARPWPIPLGRHFALDIVLCEPPATGLDAATDAPRTPTLRLDAEMPAHRHGMNYRASLRQTGPGRYLAEGLLFHMPGRWRFIFDLDPGDGAAPVRLTQEVELP